MMAAVERRSPVQFPSAPGKTEMRDHWEVVLEYPEEGSGPHLADLSHIPRWDLQDRDLVRFQPGGVAIPETPGSCALAGGVLVNRMNRTQAAVWHLAAAEAPPLPPEAAYTDVTDASACLALFGPNVSSITEKLTSLDLFPPEKMPPFLLQGPFSRVPCQITVISRNADNGAGGIVFTCSRGYGADMVDAVLAAGAAFGLRPAGENAFLRWLAEAASNPNTG
jgi:hypothetical protein